MVYLGSDGLFVVGTGCESYLDEKETWMRKLLGSDELLSSNEMFGCEGLPGCEDVRCERVVDANNY